MARSYGCSAPGSPSTPTTGTPGAATTWSRAAATPGFQSPLHRHNRYAERFYVLEGELTVWAGRQTAVLRPGDVFTVPAGTAHAVAVTGDRPARALAVASPSGLARLVTGAGTPDTGGEPPDGPPDTALFYRTCAEVGDEVLGPPVALPEPEPCPPG